MWYLNRSLLFNRQIKINDIFLFYWLTIVDITHEWQWYIGDLWLWLVEFAYLGNRYLEHANIFVDFNLLRNLHLNDSTRQGRFTASVVVLVTTMSRRCFLFVFSRLVATCTEDFNRRSCSAKNKTTCVHDIVTTSAGRTVHDTRTRVAGFRDVSVTLRRRLVRSNQRVENSRPERNNARKKVQLRGGREIVTRDSNDSITTTSVRWPRYKNVEKSRAADLKNTVKLTLNSFTSMLRPKGSNYSENAENVD